MLYFTLPEIPPLPRRGSLSFFFRYTRQIGRRKTRYCVVDERGLGHADRFRCTSLDRDVDRLINRDSMYERGRMRSWLLQQQRRSHEYE